MKIFKCGALIIIALLNIVAVPAVFAQDSLQILPTRMVLGRQTSGELTLINRGSTVGTYRILLRNIRADDHGKFAEAKEAKDGELHADKFVRFSPRRVTVNPGSFQKVRVMVRKPRDLADGEYRTHMIFQTLPEQTSNSLDDSSNGDVEVSVQTIVELAIPIIVRNGKLEAEVELGDTSIKDNKVNFSLLRSGTRSLYGDAEILINSGANKNTRVGFARGLAVYYPNPIRKVEIPLDFPDGVSANGQELILKFTEDEQYGGTLSTNKVISLN